MGDNILQGTLNPQSDNAVPIKPGGFNVPNLKTINPKKGEIKKDMPGVYENIRTLTQAQAKPGEMEAFQKAMSLATTTAYNKRKESEKSSMAFDPSKVSGNFFGSVVDKMRTEREGDSSKIYGANMQVYRGAQAEINKRLDYINDLENKKRQYITAWRYDYMAAKKLDVGKSRALKRLKQERKDFAREYLQAMNQAGKDTSYMDFSADEIRQGIVAMAERNHSMDAVRKALNLEGVPTFPGSTASTYLTEVFNK